MESSELFFALLDTSARGPADNSFWSHDPWIAFNRELSHAATALPNEADLCRALETAQNLDAERPAVFWLTMARITELTIKLAGDYADTGEVRAAGDLLVNPREIDVYLRGHSVAIRKDRHMGLSEQFAAAIGDEDPVAWLMREAQVRIKREALLPHLKDLLFSSGRMASDYLDGIEQRLCRIADTMGFMCTLETVGDQGTIGPCLEADRALIEERKCRFSDRRFVEMGEEIERMILSGSHRCRFLKPVCRFCPS